MNSHTSAVPASPPITTSKTMSAHEWQQAIRFDAIDRGWIIMSIGMAIGAGIVFLPVQVGVVGLWVYLLSAVIGYPALYLFQRLFVNTLALSPKCEDYPTVIGQYLGKNWGLLLGLLYFIMIVISLFCYSTAITNDSAAFLYTFHVTDTSLASNPWYGLCVIILLIALAAQGEKLIFKISTGLVITKLFAIIILGLCMAPYWSLQNISSLPSVTDGLYQAFHMLPLTLTSILFMQTLSPMVISYRAHHRSIAVARHKALRAMNISFAILFTAVFFFALSFTFAMSHDQAVMAAEQNISALAIAAREIDGDTVKVLSLLLNIFAITTAFFGVFLAFKEGFRGMLLNLLRRLITPTDMHYRLVAVVTLIVGVAVSWLAVYLNIPVIRLLTYMGPIMGILGCFLPVYLVYKVPALAQLKGATLWFIVAAGLLLSASPYL